MPIFYNQETKTFTINTENSTYAMYVAPYDLLTHIYYGDKVSDGVSLNYLETRCGTGRNLAPSETVYEDYEENGHARYCNLSRLLEYSTFGVGDNRTPSLIGKFADGSRIIDLRYVSHEIVDTKPSLEGLPSVYVNENEKAQTLIITLKDKVYDLFVELSYSVIEGHDQIMRSAKIINKTGKPFFIETALSLNLDMANRGKESDVITFYGKANAERQVERAPLPYGKVVSESYIGATSHFSSNSVILCDRFATEDHGEVYAAALVYSGNYALGVEKDHSNRIRISMGINPAGFTWKLEDGESFTTPEAVITYSNEGLSRMSLGMHDLIRYNVCRGIYKDTQRPVLINNWEATVFEFDEDKLCEIAADAKKFGVDMLVVDDGWFGHRDWDNTSLGDWFPDKNKLPNGVVGLCKRINDMGMELGLWFEPENICEESKLYEEHPDWVLKAPNRDARRGRWEYCLDMSRKDVRDNIFEQMEKVLSSCPVKYIKWDMNRHIADAYSLLLSEDRQGEIIHRLILGVYEIMDRINKRFPNILFENCSSGRRRFDMGMLYYSPQIWTSDNTDPAHRLKIQYGTSLIYPVSTMGAHIAYSPNINTFHPTSVFTRGVTAMAGTFGYELDPMHETETTMKEMALMTELYKKHYFTINHGNYYRLISPYEVNPTGVSQLSAWQFVSKDKNKALFCMVQIDNVNASQDVYIKLKGLDKNKSYRLHCYYENRDIKVKPFTPWIEDKDLGVFSGEALVKAGLHTALYRGDNMSTLIELEAID